ncbi:MAG: hypothetical protein K8I82_18920 [Anaerolineae bacterium]|nr:hypothetical protein [Anaerolineae bacterium]
MKLTLWQQFSSNHSGSFEIVGRFDSPARAQEVAEILRGHFREIAEWQETNSPDGRIMGFGSAGEPLPPPEQNLVDTYHITWNTDAIVDWIYRSENIPQLVSSAADMVFMVGGDTWSNAIPFEHILEKLGGYVYATYVRDTNSVQVIVTINGEAPAKSVASSICDQVRAYLQFQTIEIPAPWLIHRGGILHPQSELLLRISQLRLELATVQEQIKNSISDPEKLQFVAKESELRSRYSALSFEEKQLFSGINFDTGVKYIMSLDETVEQDDRLFRLRKLSFGVHLNSGLPALVAWLGAQGCVVDYEFEQVVSEDSNNQG